MHFGATVQRVGRHNRNGNAATQRAVPRAANLLLIFVVDSDDRINRCGRRSQLMILMEMGNHLEDTRHLAASITRAASLQTYCTILLLADRRALDDAYRAYAYFRWVDDWLDQGSRRRSERLAFVRRQAALIQACYRGRAPSDAISEERILIDLIRGNPGRGRPLARYMENMLAVMAFDAERRGRLVSQAQLTTYQHYLAVAVSAALHYFIGRDEAPPNVAGRHSAVTAAHITHMLRDTWEDVQAGYFNIPTEFLHAHNLSAGELNAPAYRTWVERRVRLARRYFRQGRGYLAQVPSARWRIAVSAYTARFEIVLDMIERDGYRLRREYAARKSLASGLQMCWSALRSALPVQAPASGIGNLTSRRDPGKQ